jgi:radical SAM superfamily enzyme YgiQ (UPF0313 family)
MRFLLINPYYPISEGPSPPLGIAFLGAALEKAGVEVQVADFVVNPYSFSFLEEILKRFQPQFVGITSVTMTFNTAAEIVKDIKKIDPNIVTVMGGPHVSFCAEETMNLFPEIDIIVKGEGDESVVELTRAMENGRKWNQVEGILYRNSGGIHNTGPRKKLADVNSLPVPARHLLPLGRYRALNMPISMTTSRGCPFKCIFCVGRKMVGAKVRYRNAKSVVDELEYLFTLGFPQINIADDLFTANKKHCTDICNEILARGLKIKWSSFARVDTVSRDVLSKMKEAGCDAVSFGIETANADILKTIKKGITIKQVIEAVQMCIDTGVTPSASFILGLPGETPETLKETVEFGKKLKKMGVLYGFHLLAPFPGTEIRDKKDEYNIKILTNDWRMYHANKAIVETEQVTARMLDEIADNWEKNINKWLESIKEKVDSGTATDEDAFPLVNLERTLLYYQLMTEQLIEKEGIWKNSDAYPTQINCLRTLTQKLLPHTEESEEKLFHALEYATDHGNLKLHMEDSDIQWRWTDLL